MEKHKCLFALRSASIYLFLSVGIWLVSVFLGMSPRAEEGHEGRFDPGLFHAQDDGSFEVNAWLASRYGFLPVPVINTGPILDVGGGINLLCLHDKLAGQKTPDVPRVPPNMSGVAAIATENGPGCAFAKNWSTGLGMSFVR